MQVTWRLDTDRDAGYGPRRGALPERCGQRFPSVSQTALQKSCPRASAFATSPGSFSLIRPTTCPGAEGMSMGATLFAAPHSVKPSFYPYSIGKVAVRDWVMFRLGLRFGRAVLPQWTHAIEVERLGQLRCVIRLRSPRACLLQRTLAVEVERL